MDINDIIETVGGNIKDVKDIVRYCNTNKKYQKICSTKSFWLPIFKKHNLPILNNHNNVNEWYMEFIKTLDAEKEAGYTLRYLKRNQSTLLLTTDQHPIVNDQLIKLVSGYNYYTDVENIEDVDFDVVNDVMKGMYDIESINIGIFDASIRSNNKYSLTYILHDVGVDISYDLSYTELKTYLFKAYYYNLLIPPDY